MKNNTNLYRTAFEQIILWSSHLTTTFLDSGGLFSVKGHSCPKTSVPTTALKPKSWLSSRQQPMLSDKNMRKALLSKGGRSYASGRLHTLASPMFSGTPQAEGESKCLP